MTGRFSGDLSFLFLLFFPIYHHSAAADRRPTTAIMKSVALAAVASTALASATPCPTYPRRPGANHMQK